MVHLPNTPDMGLYLNKSVKFMGHSFIPLACAECDDFLLFSGASSIPVRYILYPATLPHQLFFHPPSLHLAIYFLVLLIPNSYTILFWEFMGHKVENKITNTKYSLLRILDVHHSLSRQTATEFILSGTDAGIYK
jgi:hypothetical protein